MAKLELCGVSLDLQALDDAQKAIEDALAELTSGAGGIADAIGNLQNELGDALDDALADLENLIPEIKIEFPNLQKEINELLELLADPFKALEIQAQIDKIRELFGDSDFDIDGILSDITNGLSDIAGGLSEFTGDITKALGDLAGTLSSFDPCKLVPNMDAEPQYDEFGDVIGYEYKTKAYVPDAPITDAVSLLPDEEAFGDDEVILDDIDVVSKAKPTVKTFSDTVTSVLSGLATPVVDLIPTPAKTESLTLPEVMGGGEIKFRDVGSQLAPAPEELKNKLEIPKSKLIANAYSDALADERNGGLNFGELQQIDGLKSTLPIQYKVEKAREAAGIASNVKAVVTEKFSKVAFDGITGTAAQTAQAAFSAANINNIGLDDLSPNIATKVAKSLGIPYIPKFPSINAGTTIESVTNVTANLNVPSNATPLAGGEADDFEMEDAPDGIDDENVAATQVTPIESSIQSTMSSAFGALQKVFTPEGNRSQEELEISYAKTVAKKKKVKQRQYDELIKKLTPLEQAQVINGRETALGGTTVLPEGFVRSGTGVTGGDFANVVPSGFSGSASDLPGSFSRTTTTTTALPSESTGDIEKDAEIFRQGIAGIFGSASKEANAAKESLPGIISRLKIDMTAAATEMKTDLDNLDKLEPVEFEEDSDGRIIIKSDISKSDCPKPSIPADKPIETVTIAGEQVVVESEPNVNSYNSYEEWQADIKKSREASGGSITKLLGF